MQTSENSDQTIIQNQISHIEERKSLLNPKIPEDMPSLAVVKEEISETRLPDSVIWCQGKFWQGKTQL